jgi:hypothetical protein
MRLDQILKNIGAEIVKQETSDGRTTLFVRAGKERLAAERWKAVIEELLLSCSGQKTPSWSVDLSKAFFVTEAKAVRFLWRIIFTGNVKRGLESFGTSVMRSMSQGVEVTSMPLVGRVQYEFDPALGKMKGGHSGTQAARARSVGLSGGSIQ